MGSIILLEIGAVIMRKEEEVLWDIVDQNRNDLECLTRVYQLLDLDHDIDRFHHEYQSIIQQYPIKVIDNKMSHEIKELLKYDSQAFQNFSELAFKKTTTETMLLFYIPYLIWDMIESSPKDLSNVKKVSKQLIKTNR
ncbi:MAG: hypothetical protein PUB18_01725 [bacterium]|nr:hypothetical protein [bacterium]